jgi:hypothetical protein
MNVQSQDENKNIKKGDQTSFLTLIGHYGSFIPNFRFGLLALLLLLIFIIKP